MMSRQRISQTSKLPSTYTISGVSAHPSELDSYLNQLRKARIGSSVRRKRVKPCKKGISLDQFNKEYQSALDCRSLHINTTPQQLACTKTLQQHQRPLPKSAPAAPGLPNIDSRHVCGVRRLAQMMRYSDYKPVMPSYHMMSFEDKMNYYSPAYNMKEQLPILTQFELLERIRSKKRCSSSAVNAVDGLPSPGDIDSRTVTRLDLAPDNTCVPTTPVIPDWNSEYNSPLVLKTWEHDSANG